MNSKYQDKVSRKFIEKACTWAMQFDTFCILDNHQIANAADLGEIEFVLAAGIKESVCGEGKNDWEKLMAFSDRHMGESPVFGYMSYDLKNQLEELQSGHPDYIEFAPMFFFAPQHLILIDKHGQWMVMSDKGNAIVEEIEATVIPAPQAKSVTMQARVNKETYLNDVLSLKNHIVEGDVYEINYCVEFYAENTVIDPLHTYLRLQEISPTPFSAFFCWNKRYLMNASPERFIKKSLNKLYSQPIKGTVRRSEDSEQDAALAQALRNSEKERAENLMIVDLVRNDLARSSKYGTVKVDELFGIYSFKQVHQMISTISSDIEDEVHPIEAVMHAFPMGSMTGAPKVMAMKLIEQYERTKRGLYSGSVGYIAPNEDFDFNVVIRSIQYNSESQYVNFEVGSAITFDSDPEQEYEECLLKARAMLSALQAQIA